MRSASFLRVNLSGGREQKTVRGLLRLNGAFAIEWTLGAGVNPCRPARSGPNPLRAVRSHADHSQQHILSITLCSIAVPRSNASRRTYSFG